MSRLLIFSNLVDSKMMSLAMLPLLNESTWAISFMYYALQMANGFQLGVSQESLLEM